MRKNANDIQNFINICICLSIIYYELNTTKITEEDCVQFLESVNVPTTTMLDDISSGSQIYRVSNIIFAGVIFTMLLFWANSGF